MSRRKLPFGAVAVAATAGLSFSSADGAEAIAQEAEAPVETAETEAVEPLDMAQVAEIVPQQTVFVSEPVVQELPGEAEADSFADPVEARSLRELVDIVPTGERIGEEMTCLAGAVYFESRGEPLAGPLAVAQVVINRAEDRRFPASYCGVVFQRAQFSFVKNGRMPRIRTHTPAWRRAKAIAQIAHDGMWESQARDAVYFHANYVRPRWSYRKQRLAQIDTHIFYR
jgi:hypothetical protein